MTLVALALLTGASWTLGTAALGRTLGPELRRDERLALRLTAGLGLTALLLSLLALANLFSYATIVLAALSATGVVRAAAGRGTRVARDAGARSSGRGASAPRSEGRSTTPIDVALVVTAVLACLGAVAPVTDDDALAFVMPTARHIADTGALRVWPDQARAMFPESQAVLLAYVLHSGGERVGAVTALEWLLCLGVVSALARRLCEREEHVPVALAIAFGAPVIAFQVASAKEDLLLVAATAAAAFCLSGRGARRELLAAGLFAGIAAGAKYSGLGVALAAVGWTAIARREDRWRASTVVASTAAAVGGLWYALNAVRFANPVAPFVFGAAGTHFDAALARAFNDGFGAGRGPAAFVAAPIRIFIQPELFCGRANLFNPLAYAGLAALAIGAARRRQAAAAFMCAVLYVGWFATLQNARLLLPAAVLLAPAAADRLWPRVRDARALRFAAVTMLALPLAIVSSVGAVRLARYVREPSTYLLRETQRYGDIAWMNAHLDPARDRVGSSVKVIGYLTIPSLMLDPTRQLEIAPSDFATPARLLDACRRARITHLFGARDDFDELRPHLRLVYENPASRLGGVRFFREPPTQATAVYEIRP